MNRHISGDYLIYSSLFITAILYIFSKSSISQIFLYPLLSLGQLAGLIGVVLICVSFFLSTRLSVIEDLFGGLDKVYKMHHIVGALGFIFVLNHPMFFIVESLMQKLNVQRYFFPSEDIAYSAGIMALYIFIVVIMLTVFIKLPYHIWKFTHQFMGLALLFSFIHVFFISSDTSNFLPLRIWILGLMALAFVAFLYKAFLYKYFAPKYEYILENKNSYCDILELYLKPVNKKLNFKPGQFVFISVKADGISSEEHPFTISSTPNDDFLRLSIKTLGDFVSTLSDIKLQSRVITRGPYGRTFNEFVNEKDIICIAGGIGVTPFLSLLNSQILKDQKIHFYYSVRNEGQAVYDKELSNLSQKNSNLYYNKWISDTQGILTASQIKDQIGDLSSKRIFICGPKVMMESMSFQFKKLSVKGSNIFYEDFSLK